MLYKTKESLEAWVSGQFIENFVVISDDASQFIVKCGILLVGIDYLSVGSFKYGGSLVHKTLLGGGVWLIEGLDLSQVEPG